MPPDHPLRNFEIQKYYENEPKLNGVYSRKNLPKKIKDAAYVVNLDEYADTGTKSEIVYFDSFGVEHVPEETKELIRNKNIVVQYNEAIGTISSHFIFFTKRF